MSATAEVENATVEQQPTETPTVEPPEKQEAEKKPAKQKKTKAPKGKKMKRSAMTDVSSSREAEEGGVVEKKLKPYVYVPSRMRNEMKSLKEAKEESSASASSNGSSNAKAEAPKPKTAPHGSRKTWLKYLWQIHESQGFDVVDFPGCSLTSRPSIMPYPFINEYYVEPVNVICREALSKFNSLNGSDYEFVKVEKANAITCAGYIFFITFQARKPATDSLVTFQTRAYEAISRTKIHFCRLKKDARGPINSNLDQGKKSEIEAQDVADARGPIDGKLDQGITSNLEAQGVAGAGGPIHSKLDQGIKSDVEAQDEAAAAGPRRSNRLRAIRQSLENCV